MLHPLLGKAQPQSPPMYRFRSIFSLNRYTACLLYFTWYCCVRCFVLELFSCCFLLFPLAPNDVSTRIVFGQSIKINSSSICRLWLLGYPVLTLAHEVWGGDTLHRRWALFSHWYNLHVDNRISRLIPCYTLIMSMINGKSFGQKKLVPRSLLISMQIPININFKEKCNCIL